MENTYKDMLAGINKAIDNLNKTIIYYKTFSHNPESVANELHLLGDEDLNIAFKGVLTGLNGEFTRQQAISMGQRALQASIVKSLNTLVISFEERDTCLKATVKLIRDVYFSITEGIDLSMLVKRREVYSKDDLSVKYFMARAASKLEPTILKEMGTTESPLNYVTRMANVLKELASTQPLNDVQTLLTNYANTENYLKALESNNADVISSKGDSSEVEAKVIDINDDMLRKLALTFLQNTTITETKANLLEAINDVVDNITTSMTSLTTTLKILEDLDTKLPTSITVVKTYAETLRNDTESYMKGSISEQEYDNTVLVNVSRLISRYNANVIFDTELLFRLAKYGRQLYNMNSIYIAMDTVTLAGSLPSGGGNN